ncbi:MAG: GldG family protein [Deltaproteobacteria bacterium]|nr:GldG family protein [Deltaproteobacteria bacterium]
MSPADVPTPRPRDPSRERASIGLNSLARVLLVLGLFVMVNYLSARHYVRADMTRKSLYSLSAKTKRVLGGLHSDVQVDVFLSQGDSIYGDVKELFSRYRAQSPRIKVRFIDPDLDRARFELMKSRYGIREGRLPDGRTITDTAIVVSSGERHWFVTQDDMVEVDFSGAEMGGGPELKGFKAEGALTSAIVNVTTADKPKICFTKGHGELSIDDFGERGLSHLAEALKRDNYETQAIETYGRPSVPSGCSAVIVAGPTRPFAEEEAASLRSFVEGGGKLALLLDPIIDGSRFVPTGLEGIAEHFGVKIDQDIVVETDAKRLTTVGGLETFAAMDWATGHALAEPFREAPLLVSIARSVRKAEGGTALVTEIVKTSDSSWGETDLARMQAGDEPAKGADDVEPPASLAAAVEVGESERKGRLVVVGDADFLARALFENPTLVNQDFGLGIVSWLSQRENLISIAPKDVENVHMNLSEDQLFWIRTYSVYCMPLAALFVGVVVWLRRRQ